MRHVRRWITLGILGAVLVFGYETTAAQHRSTSVKERDGTRQYQWVDDDYRLEVDVHGEVTFTPDDTGVASLERGGWLTVKESKNRRTRELDVRPADGGTLRYTYRVDGRARAYDAAARAEMADLFLVVIRETGWNADERVARLLKEGGVDGVFDEIEQIRSSSANRRYFVALLEQGSLTSAELRRFADEAVDQIASSGDRSRLLMAAVPYFLADGAPYGAYFDAVNTLPSSGDHARVLLHVLDDHKPDRDERVALLVSAERLRSSGDKARVLIQATAYYANDPAIRTAFFDAVNTLPSSGDHARVLMALLEREPALDAASTAALFRSAEGIPSSGDRSRVLIRAAPQFIDDAAQRAAFFEAVDTIPSSGDHARVLLALLEHDDLSVPTLQALLGSCKGISSSGDKTRVLVRAADRVSDDDTLVDAYLAAAETISSSSDHSRALAALVR